MEEAFGIVDSKATGPPPHLSVRIVSLPSAIPHHHHHHVFCSATLLIIGLGNNPQDEVKMVESSGHVLLVHSRLQGCYSCTRYGLAISLSLWREILEMCSLKYTMHCQVWLFPAQERQVTQETT